MREAEAAFRHLTGAPKSLSFYLDYACTNYRAPEREISIEDAADSYLATRKQEHARGLLSGSENESGSAMLKGALRSSASQQWEALANQHRGVTRDQATALDRGRDALRAGGQNSLAELADATGGFLIANSNDLRTPLRRVSEDIGSYYELAYAPHIEKLDGSFRKISVRVSEV